MKRRGYSKHNNILYLYAAIALEFSTKDRYPFLAQNDLLLRTRAYLGGILRESDCPSLTIGGTADHVHAFFRLSRTQQMAKVVETLKSHSSRWIKSQDVGNFGWQRGYGCFSVGKSQAANAGAIYSESGRSPYAGTTESAERRGLVLSPKAC